MTRQVLRVSDPLRIGGPRRVELSYGIRITVSVDLCRTAVRDLHRPEIIVIVFEQNVSAVGRPRESIEVRSSWQCNRAGLTNAHRIADHECVFTTSIG